MSETPRSKAAQKLHENKRAKKEIKEEETQEPVTKKRRTVYDVLRDHDGLLEALEEKAKEGFQDQQQQIDEILKRVQYCETICKAIEDSEKELEENDTKKKK
jgi:uncharacterized protein YukE